MPAGVRMLTGPAGCHLAYEVTGTGPTDVVVVPDGLLPVAALRRYPPFALFLHELATLGRLVLLDRRGIGASSWAPGSGTLGPAEWAEDLRTVLDALHSTRAVVVGLAEGAMTAVAFAARYPERTGAVVLVNATPGPSVGEVARRGAGPAHIEWLRSNLLQPSSEELPGMELLAPSVGRDEAFAAWVHGAFVEAVDPRRYLPAFDAALRSNVVGMLTQVAAPTLVIHRREDRWFSVDHGRLLAGAIPGARYLELPGADHAPYTGDTSALLGAIRWFLGDVADASSEAPAMGRPSGVVLTSRQQAVLELVGAGLSDKSVAAELGLCVRTVQKHLERAYQRLGVHNRTGAVSAYRALARRGPNRGTSPTCSPHGSPARGAPSGTAST